LGDVRLHSARFRRDRHHGAAGVVTGIAGNPNAPVSVSWKEPQPGHDTRTVAGAVPIQMRSVILNIASLTPGDYTLEVSVKKPGKDAVKSVREFALK
jgi:hypothetical protein